MPLDYLWKRCMEFVGENSAGKLQKHFVDPEKGTVYKVVIFCLKKKQLNFLTIAITSRTITSQTITVTTLTSKSTRTTTKKKHDWQQYRTAVSAVKESLKNLATFTSNIIIIIINMFFQQGAHSQIVIFSEALKLEQ